MLPFRLRAALPVALFLAVTVGATAQAKKKASYRAPTSANRDSLTRILSAENQRTLKDAYLATAIHHPTPSVRQAAIFAVARIGDASLLGELSGMLNRRRGTNKNDVAFALGLIPDDTAVTMAIQHLAMQQDPGVLADLYVSIGRGGSEKNVALFANALSNVANPQVLEGVCRGLGLLWAKDSESWVVPPGIHMLLIQRAKQTDGLALNCSFALSRFKGLPSHIPPSEVVKLVDAVKNKDAIPFLLKVLAKIESPSATAVLVQRAAPFYSPPVRIETLKSLASHPISPAVLGAIRNGIAAPQNAVVYQALDTAQAFETAASELSPAIVELFKKTPSVWIRGKALRAGAAAAPEVWKPLVLKELADGKSTIRAPAGAAFAAVAVPTDAPLLGAIVQDPDPRVALDTLEALSDRPDGFFNSELRATFKTLVEKKDPAVVSAVAGIVEKHHWKEFAAPLASAYATMGRPDLVESKVAVLSALSSLGSADTVPIFESALKDPDRLVVSAAVEGLREIASRDESGQIPLNSKPTPFPFTSAEIQEAANARVQLKTSRGEITLKLAKEAPLNSVHFIRLVKKHFYDGLTFHRIVPGFVVQGGDPRADGFGGPGYLVRDEVSPRSHLRGTIGLATSGKDTGGSQFFINLAPNLHLDGRYTVFGEVTDGMDVADKLEVGDKILSARLKP